VLRYGLVFVAPPWREIYVNDAERGQDWAEAVRSYDALVAGYAAVGYPLIELPRVDVPARLEFVLAHLRG
jgi:predicted ATPase